ncbi:MAG: DUF4198 domain-containing protein [Phycisphaeraceae bacterium]
MKRTIRPVVFGVALLAGLAGSAARAHDSWVQTNTNAVDVGQVMHVDLMLGNHGNHHRDFRLAGKVDPEFATFDVVTPDGETLDLKPDLVDLGTESNPGYWSVRFVPDQAGMHTIAHTYDRVVHYAPLRSVKSAKTYVMARAEHGNPPQASEAFNQPLCHPLELVPQNDPTALAPGEPLEVRLLFHGEPLADAHIAFIPRGHELAGDFDEDYEQHTDESGLATFTPGESNYYLIIAHHTDATASGEAYDATKYSAALVVHLQ